MKIKTFIFLLSITVYSCENSSEDTFIMSDSNMEGTISIGASVKFSKFEALSRNDIVVFKDPLTKSQTCLRIIALPGDELEIVKGVIFLNKLPFDLPNSSRKIYTVYSKNNNFSKLVNYRFKEYSESYGMVSVNKNEFNEIRNGNLVDSIYLLGFDSSYIFPGIVKVGSSKKFNHFYFGPIKVPNENDTIFESDKTLVNQFISFSEDYLIVNEPLYFCIGDSFSDAIDSRVIGLIPRSKIVGRVNPIQNKVVIDVTPIPGK